MTIEDKIAALLAQAEPLRSLPDDQAESMGLPGIVEQINALRVGQANDPVIERKKPGPKPKPKVEGQDA